MLGDVHAIFDARRYYEHRVRRVGIFFLQNKTLKSIVVDFALLLKIRFEEEDRNLAYVHVSVNATNINCLLLNGKILKRRRSIKHSIIFQHYQTKHPIPKPTKL